jgi:host factor-I protein
MKEKTQSPSAMDHFLFVAWQKKETVDVFLRSAKRLTGRIKGFDRYSILLDQYGVESLVFKSAVLAVRKPKHRRALVSNRFGRDLAVTGATDPATAATLRPSTEGIPRSQIIKADD